jgi:predicted nucleic acid-binding protein
MKYERKGYLKRVYLDTNVLVMALLKKDSNSRIAFDMVNEGKIRAVISDYSMKELKAVLRRLVKKKDADRRCYFFLKMVSLNPFFEIVNYVQHKSKKEKYESLIVEKDLPHLVIAAEEKVEAIIAKDRHFINQNMMTVLTPKQLLEEMGMKTFESDL